MNRRILVCAGVVAASVSLKAAMVQFSLDGIVGTSLLTGNEVHVVSSGGSGGIGAGGISYDTSTRVLSVDLDWGSANGFTDLSGAATGAHIHGPTGPLPSGLTHTAPVLYNFGSEAGITFNTSASNGGISGTLTIDAIDEASLLGGQTYINIHTALNGNGEIRGQLIAAAVPEPHEWGAMIGVGLLGFGVMRRRWLAKHAVVAGITLMAFSMNAQAQVLWNFSTSNGTHTVSGQLKTNGTYANTQGTGNHTFTGLSWDSYFYNGVDQTPNFASGVPSTFDPGAFNTFVWSRDQQKVTSLPGLALIGTEPGPDSDSQISWVLAGSVVSSTIVDTTDNAPFVIFGPTVSTLTPIPEPSEYAALAGLGLIGFAMWRRRSRQTICA